MKCQVEDNFRKMLCIATHDSSSSSNSGFLVTRKLVLCSESTRKCLNVFPHGGNLPLVASRACVWQQMWNGTKNSQAGQT